MKKELIKKPDVITSIHVDSRGVGRMVPTTTTLLILLATLEDDKWSQISVICSVIEEIGFTPEDIARYFRNQEKRHKNINWPTEETMERYSWEEDDNTTKA